MAELYNVTLGTHVFTAQPDIAVRGEAVVRENASPNLRVAINYTFSLRCRIPATTDALATVPPSAATALGTFLALVHNRALPTLLKIADSAGTAIPQIGDITLANGWEDLQITDHDLPRGADQAGQLVAGAWFTLTFKARKALPDSDGICELSQVYENDTDETGAEVRRLASTIRISQAAYTAGSRIGGTSATAAYTTKLALPCPVGWSRTRGKNAWGFAARYPLYERGAQDGLVAETVSEIRTNGGVAGASGATDSEVSTRIRQDPEKGLVRTTTVAETTGPLSSVGLEWVEEQQPADSTGETLEEPNKRHVRGEWTVIDALFASSKSCVRRVTRGYVLRGVGRGATTIPMANGLRPKIALGAHTTPRLTETVRVLAQGPIAMSDVPLPLPLEEPWVLDGEPLEDSLPGVDEHAGASSQRLWQRVVTRQYLWRGPGDALAHLPLQKRVMSDAGTNLAVLEVS